MYTFGAFGLQLSWADAVTAAGLQLESGNLHPMWCRRCSGQRGQVRGPIQKETTSLHWPSTFVGAFGSQWLDPLTRLARHAVSRQQHGEQAIFNLAGSLTQPTPCICELAVSSCGLWLSSGTTFRRLVSVTCGCN
eukprot:SM000027S09689  [mRNA]  locus=s27:733355:733855:+ [translate_table: standard]